MTSNSIEEEVKYPSIDDLTSEKRTYLDSEIFEYNGESYRYSKCSEFCEQFIRSYKRPKSSKFHYMDLLSRMMVDGAITLVIDYNDICSSHIMDEETMHSNFFYNLIQQNPKLFLKAFRKAAFDVLLRIHYDYAMEIRHNFKVSLADASMFKKEITEINNDDVGHLIYVENFVVSISAQKNYTRRMAWMCGECGKLTYKDSIGFKLPRIHTCMYCESKDISESLKDAITDTMQEIKLQQKFEKIVSGRVPKTIMGVIFGKDRVNPVQAGDIAAVTGIVDLQPSPVSSENAVAEYYIEIQYIEKKADDFLLEDDPELEQKVKTFIDPDNEDEGYQNLIESIAPSVMGHEILKEALLLQMVGSEVGYFQDNTRHRGEINLLLVGDAGTAKSKLARFVYQLYARSVYVSGKTTEAGITATVVLTKNGTPVLEAGAYLLASSDNGGLVVCDEMEKTKKEAREAIAGCLDDNGMVEIHKSTIHQSIQINNASLHIANPKTGESWDTSLSIKDNTGFETWYLSRFCTFIVRDEVDKEMDTKKAKHYLEQFGNTRRQYKIKDGDINDLRLRHKLSYGENKNIHSVQEMAFFNKYVRRTCKPEFDYKSAAGKKLINYYISVRPFNASGKGHKVTLRALGDLVRFAEASARAHMRNEVTVKDADIAIKIVQASIASSGFNMFTGEYDLHAMEQEEKKKKAGVAVGDNIFSAKELFENKVAFEITEDIERLAQKRANRFYKEVASKMRLVTKAIQRYAIQKCRDCGGNGYRKEGGMSNACYNCESAGGFVSEFPISEVNYILEQRGLSQADITECITSLLKKKIITPKFNSKNSYQIVHKDKELSPYQDALRNFAAVEANIAMVVDLEEEANKSLVRTPEMQEKINKLKNIMNPDVMKDVDKRLAELDEDEE